VKVGRAEGRGCLPQGAGAESWRAACAGSSLTSCDVKRWSRVRAGGVPIASIEQSLLDSGVSIHPSVAQKWPMRPMLVHAAPIDFANDDLFFVD